LLLSTLTVGGYLMVAGPEVAPPARVGTWVRVQRYRLGWLLLGVCAGVLLLL